MIYVDSCTRIYVQRTNLVRLFVTLDVVVVVDIIGKCRFCKTEYRKGTFTFLSQGLVASQSTNDVSWQIQIS